MANQPTMAELLQAPIEGYGDAIVIPAILAENFELKHGLLNLVTSKHFYGFEKEDPHAYIRCFNKITSTIKYKDVPNSSIKLMLFSIFYRGGNQDLARKRTPSFYSYLGRPCFQAWDRFKDLLRACPHHGFTELHQLDTFYNALTPTDQDSLNAAVGGNLLTKTPRDALAIIENKSKVRNSRNKPVVSKVSTNAPSSSTPHFTEIATLADALKAMLLQKSSPLASMKAIEEICVTCGGPHPYHQFLATDGNVFLEYQDNIQGYVSAAAINYNQGNTEYRPQSVANQIRPSGKFHFPADFVVVDYVFDPRVPLILGRPFLRTTRALIHVYGEELTLLVDDKAITFKVVQTSRYSYNDVVSINRIDVIDVAYEEYAQEVLGFSDSSTSGNPTPSLDPILSTFSPSLTPFEEGDFILEEIEYCLTNDSIPSGIDDADFDLEGDLLLLEKLLNDDPSSPLPPKEIHVEELKIVKSSIDDPPELELKDLPSHHEYAFLEGTDKLPVISLLKHKRKMMKGPTSKGFKVKQACHRLENL
ncbi:hypothetical protein Tco_1554240 [Tanacetum coccineum]